MGNEIKQPTQLTARFALCVLLVVGGFIAGAVFDRQGLSTVAPIADVPASAQPDFQLMAQAWNVITDTYVDRAAVIPRNLTYGAISGMVDALGDTGHSRFLTPKMVKEENNQEQGQLNGVGIEVEVKNGNIVVVAPLDNTPAQKAGIRAGDIIESVDGKSVSGLSLSQVVSMVTGPPGTSVTLTIVDPSTNTTHNYKLTRAKITIDNAVWQPLPGTTVAHVRVAAFSQGVSKDLQKVLAQVSQQHMTSVILDLRDNPGGLLSEAVGVTSQFVVTGNVLLEKDAKGKITPIPVEPSGPVNSLPMVVLVNQGTASAAEITAGAIQDAQRAKLVGEVTFGTGTVLNQVGLSDGSAILIAVQEWLTPSGKTIWHKGITPDVTVSLPHNVSPLTPEVERSMTAAQVRSSGDAQLLKGYELLTGKSY